MPDTDMTAAEGLEPNPADVKALMEAVREDFYPGPMGGCTERFALRLLRDGWSRRAPTPPGGGEDGVLRVLREAKERGERPVPLEDWAAPSPGAEEIKQLLADLTRVRSTHVEGSFWREAIDRTMGYLSRLQSAREGEDARPSVQVQHAYLPESEKPPGEGWERTHMTCNSTADGSLRVWWRPSPRPGEEERLREQTIRYGITRGLSYVGGTGTSNGQAREALTAALAALRSATQDEGAAQPRPEDGAQ